ncbi:hypothetical protein H5T51_02360 [Candidatus Bathyarchaeota archaeon]|nr:hypothetical protein [Candidatus Bathyarchaeota archaeon]
MAVRDKIAELRRLIIGRRGISPAISSVVLTSAIVVMLITTMVFAGNFLDARITENEFNTMKQFMQTVALQIDDVAWIPGRIQTLRYASRYGQVEVIENALNYHIYAYNTTIADWSLIGNYTTGIIAFNMPISRYSLGNNHHELIFPSSNSFIQNGSSAPTSHVFVVEKLPMYDGYYLRIVVAPSIRFLNASLGENRHFKFYLPILESSGIHPQRSQSITLAGNSVTVLTEAAPSIKINITFPRSADGFTSDFFNFESTEEIINPLGGEAFLVEFYSGEVSVSLGLHG